jgi:Tfp pilus assembly PilM family ATPase
LSGDHVTQIWKQALQKDTVVIAPSWFAAPKKSNQQVLETAAKQFGTVLGLSTVFV